MRIWTFPEECETEVTMPHMGLRRWRKVLGVGLWWFGVATEMKHERWYDKPSGDWSETGLLYAHVIVTRHWAWGMSHTYYDGPHCMFSLGFLHLQWGPEWCTKCAPPSEPP